jgi:septal ring factor EnvC (AmiA/AmiB activator)
VDSKQIIEALTTEKEEHEAAIRQAVKERKELNASIKTHREELASIDRLLRAAAGRKPAVEPGRKGGSPLASVAAAS